jgi:hypothetical protein
MFKALKWQQDRMVLDDLVFRLEHYKNEKWELDNNCFMFYKVKPLVDQYERFWDLHPVFKANNVFELGIWDGGSTAFWFEIFAPQKYVAIDIAQREDSDYFRQYVKSRGLEQRLKTFWGIDQSDADRLREMVITEFQAPLDLVIDDASH